MGFIPSFHLGRILEIKSAIPFSPSQLVAELWACASAVRSASPENFPAIGSALGAARPPFLPPCWHETWVPRNEGQEASGTYGK